MGVGNAEGASATVWSSDGPGRQDDGSRYVTKLGKVGLGNALPPRETLCDVFDNDHLRLAFIHDPHHLTPQRRPGPVRDACAFAGNG